MTNTELGFAITQLASPSAISQTVPVVVTIDDHGLQRGQVVRATRFYALPLAEATGMEQLNNRAFVVENTTENTFELFDQYGDPIDGTNYTAYIPNGLGQFNLTGPDLFTQNLNVMET
jgi:hypothetical protein